MSKTLKYGSHDFPQSAGFTASSGKVQSIKPYTRAVGKRTPVTGIAGAGAPMVSAAPKGKFARATVPHPGTPLRKPKLAAPPMPVGSAVVKPAVRKITQEDVMHGGSAPLLPGYKKGGPVTKC
jgi:hypothetical protein